MAASSDPPPSDSTLNSNQSNGTTSQNSWESPWNIAEIKKNSVDWTLAGDAGLLNYLQAFSQKLISQTHSIEKELSKVVQDSKCTNSRLNNAINDFLNLCNTQFVENRVYEEDIEEGNEGDKKKEIKEKSKEEKEAELIPKISSALNLGLGIIDTDYIKIELDPNDSDSDDEENALDAENLLEAKDPYVHRNLPFLIGSSAFHEDEFVGLRDESSEDTKSEFDQESEGKSDSESDESESQESESEESYSSDSEDEIIKNASKKIEESWEHTDGSDMFDNSDEDDDKLSDISSQDEDEIDNNDESDNDSVEANENSEPITPKPKLDFNAELTKKLGLPSKKTEHSPKMEAKRDRKNTSDSISSKKSKSKKKASSKKRSDSTISTASSVYKADDDMFAPAIDEDESSPFSQKGGMFSGGTSLFDDSDDGGLFGNKSSKIDSPKKDAEKKSGTKKRSSSKISGKSKKSESVTADSLFNEDEEDLFSSNPRKKSTSRSKANSIVSRKDTAKSSLFGDDEDESIASDTTADEKPAKPQNKMLPPGAVPMFAEGFGNTLQAALRSRRLDSDSVEDQSDGFEDSTTVSVSKKNSVSTPSKVSNEKPNAKTSATSAKAKNNLFSDQADDGLFGTTEPTSKPQVAKSSSKAPNLFDGSSIFSDEEDGGSLFSNKETSKTKKENQKQSSNNTTPKNKSKASLFDAEDDLFAVAAKPKDSGKKKQKSGFSYFDDDSSPEFEKFPSKPTQPEKKAINTTDSSSKSKRSATVVSLFDDDDDDFDESDGGLFSSASKPSDVKPKHSKSKSSLFEDDEDLFSDSKKESPGIDLFAEKGKVKVDKSEDTPKIVPKATTPLVKSSSKPKGLFDNDDDSDMDDFMSPDVIKREKSPSILNEGFNSSTEEVKRVPMKEPSNDEDIGKSLAENSSKVEVPTPKKIPGAVSMFGGIDPFAAKKKLNSPSKSPIKELQASLSSKTNEEKEVDDVRKESDVSGIGSEKQEDDHNERSNSNVSEKKIGAVTETVSPVKSPSKINFNPATMLPGATPPKVEFKESSISFDEPPQSETLKNVVKHRVKMDSNRRRPSRKGRQATARMSAIDVSLPTETVIEPKPKSEPSTPMKVPETSIPDHIVPPDFDDTDTGLSYKTTGLPDDIFSPETEEEDLFAVMPTKSLRDESAGVTPFASSSNKVSSVVDDDDDDIFSNKFSKPSSQTESDKIDKAKANVSPVKQAAKSDIFDDTGDDLFGSSSKSTKVPEKAVAEKSSTNAFDDDDLFGVSPSKGTTSSKEVKKTITAKKNSKTTTMKPSKNLFDDDDDDIFSNITKTKKSSKTKSGSLFGDDDSDIFADTKPSKPRSESKVKKPANKQKLQSEDIFDDPLMGGLK